MRKRLGRAWTIWGHLNNAQQLVVTLTAALPFVLGVVGARQTSELQAFGFGLMAAAGAGALVFILYLMLAGRLGLLPSIERRVFIDRMEASVVPTAQLETKVVRSDEFKDAPHLLWSAVRVAKTVERSWEVWVECSNVGRVAVVRPESSVESTVEIVVPVLPDDPSAHRGPIPARKTYQSEGIEFFDFDTQGPIHPGTFTLRLRFTKPDLLPGDREVKWRILYMDDDLGTGFMTECSATIRLLMGAAKVVGTPVLDSTSRRQRNEAYNAFMSTPTSAVEERPPIIALDEVHDELMGPDGKPDFRLTQLWFKNMSTDDVTAQRVTATISIPEDLTSYKPLPPPFVGYWIPENLAGDMGPLVASALVAEKDIAPNDIPAKLNIVLKWPGEDECFLFWREGFAAYPNGRHPRQRLGLGSHVVVVHLRGIGLGRGQTFALDLLNTRERVQVALRRDDR